MNVAQIIDFASVTTAPEHYRPAAEKIPQGRPEQSVRNHYGSLRPVQRGHLGRRRRPVDDQLHRARVLPRFSRRVGNPRPDGNAKTVRRRPLCHPGRSRGTWEVLEPRKVYVIFEARRKPNRNTRFRGHPD